MTERPIDRRTVLKLAIGAGLAAAGCQAPEQAKVTKKPNMNSIVKPVNPPRRSA